MIEWARKYSIEYGECDGPKREVHADRIDLLGVLDQ